MKLEWGIVGPLSDEEHVNAFARTLKATREYFGMDGDTTMHGLYLDGGDERAGDVVFCFVGNSPSAGERALALMDAWNNRMEAERRISSLEKSLAGMLESYDVLMEDVFEPGSLVWRQIKGAFLFEPKRARELLEGDDKVKTGFQRPSGLDKLTLADIQRI